MAEEALKTRIVYVDPRDLKLLDVNAHYMRHETYARLVENLKRDGELTSVPFGVALPESSDEAPRYEVLSGNHRVRASIEAGLTRIPLMIPEEPLTKDQRLAIQLSHNAIVGEDDPALLASLYDQMEDIDWRIYSGLDDKQLELLGQAKVESIGEADLSFQSVHFIFLPAERERVEAAWKAAKELLGNADATWLFRIDEFNRFLDALDSIADAHNTGTPAVELGIMLDIFDRHKTDLMEGYLDDNGEPTRHDWVPVETVLGNHLIPAEVASILNRCIARMIQSGDCTDNSRWKAIEYLCADYLASGS